MPESPLVPPNQVSLPFIRINMPKIGFQVSELFDQELLREKAYRVCELKNVILEHLYHKPLLDPEEIIKELLSYRDMVEPYVCDTSLISMRPLRSRNILLEGSWAPLRTGSWYLSHGDILLHTGCLWSHWRRHSSL